MKSADSLNNIPLEQRIQNIQSDQLHGAAFLAREALRTLLESVQSGPSEDRREVRDRFLEAARQILGIRPSMPAIGHLVVRATERVQGVYLEGLQGKEFSRRTSEGIEKIVASSRQAHEETVRRAADFLQGGCSVLTLSLSSNVQDALLRAKEKVKRVFVAEARPMNEGRQLAGILAESQIPVTLMTDAAMGQALNQVDLCLVGADGVLQDGSLINKAGSYLLALAASERKVPFYSICETYKYHVGAVPFEFEHKDPSEVSEPIPGVDISNCYFEIVPSHLIQGYVTELGVVTPRLASEQCRRWQRKLSGKNLFGKWD